MDAYCIACFLTTEDGVVDLTPFRGLYERPHSARRNSHVHTGGEGRLEAHGGLSYGSEETA